MFVVNSQTVALSPLEQFAIIPYIPLKIWIFDVSIINEVVIYLLVFGIGYLFVSRIVSRKDNTFIFYSKEYVETAKLEILYENIKEATAVLSRSYYVVGQGLVEELYLIILNLVIDNIRHEDGQKYFSLVFVTFLFVLSLNLIGLVPASFTVTSHLIITFALAIILFTGITLMAIRRHKLKFFGLFLPSGMSIAFAFLLTPIEILSYFFRPISLSVRLFANMMAGHTLLKVIAGFAVTMFNLENILILGGFITVSVLPLLFILEVAVAVIQAFVFAILISIYLNDALALH